MRPLLPKCYSAEKCPPGPTVKVTNVVDDNSFHAVGTAKSVERDLGKAGDMFITSMEELRCQPELPKTLLV